MKDVVIIGAGPAGITAGIYAAKNGCNVKILERNNEPLKKLLITGNGKCNYFNDDMSLIHFYSSNREKINNIVNEKNIKKINDFFDKIGIVPNIKKGYYYPYSNTSISMKNALLKEASLYDIQIINNTFVKEIIKEDKFIIKTNNEEINADTVILACGGCSAAPTGSDGNGYALATSFNHSLIKPLPALVKLNSTKNLKGFDKIRCEVKLSLYENEQLIIEEYGEVQFTNTGISGICVYNLSNYITRRLYDSKEEKISINFIPFTNCHNISDVLTFLDKRSETVTGRTTLEFLEGFLNYKIIKNILNEANINPLKYYDELNKKEKYRLAENLLAFNIPVASVGSFAQSQVTSGGIPLNEINEHMQSKKIPNLYFAGELLDVNGDCGGYNLTFAFITGMLAGSDIK